MSFFFHLAVQSRAMITDWCCPGFVSTTAGCRQIHPCPPVRKKTRKRWLFVNTISVWTGRRRVRYCAYIFEDVKRQRKQTENSIFRQPFVSLSVFVQLDLSLLHYAAVLWETLFLDMLFLPFSSCIWSSKLHKIVLFTCAFSGLYGWIWSFKHLLTWIGFPS